MHLDSNFQLVNGCIIFFLIAWWGVVSHFACMYVCGRITCMWTDYMHVDRLHYMWTDCMYVDIMKPAPFLINICISLRISPLFFVFDVKVTIPFGWHVRNLLEGVFLLVGLAKSPPT